MTHITYKTAFEKWLKEHIDNEEDKRLHDEAVFILHQYQILSRHDEPKEEPLAVLADEAGFSLSVCNCGDDNGDDWWQIMLTDEKILGNHNDMTLQGRTYAAAETKARQYLESLPDKGGK